MAEDLCGRFATRRAAELAVEHLVQEHDVPRTPVTIRAAGVENSAGTEVAGADTESGHPGVEKDGHPKLAGLIEVRVACEAGARALVEKVMREAGGQVG